MNMTKGEEELGLPKLHEAGIPDIEETPVNVLIVDDDPRNLAALEATLEAPAYRLVRAETADDALRALIADEFALLVLDVRMPEMNGLELARVIKQRKKTQHLPIIFLTAYYQEDNQALLGYDAGAVDYLTKPFNPAVLRSKVAVFADLYRMNRALQEEIAMRQETELQLAQKSAEVQRLVRQLRALALELSQTEQRERRRLANILHDHMQQLLVSAKMQLAALTRNDDLGPKTETVERIEQTIQEALAISRSVTVELSPPVLQRGSLREALLWLSERLMELHQLTVTVNGHAYPEPASDDERFLLFECTRELLFNAIKHSSASEIAVELSGQDGQHIKIVVSDRGGGFDKALLFSQKNATFGLFSVQQRLTHLGGSLDVESAPGKGTRVTIIAPTHRADNPHTLRNGQAT
jgi:signal transduction histidine kinase